MEKKYYCKRKMLFFYADIFVIGNIFYFFDCFSLNTTVNLATKYIILIKKIIVLI